jgi:preprotein translocase subunit SecF
MAEAQSKKPAAARKAGEPVQRFVTLLPDDLNIDFVGKRKFFLVLSTLLNIAAVVLFFTKGFNYGVDFTGGTAVRIRFAEPTSAAQVREDLSDIELRDLTVQDFGEQGKEFLLRFEVSEGEEMSSIPDTLKNIFSEKRPKAGFEILSLESVGPKVAGDLWWKGFWAVAIATVFMGIYIAFRFEGSFGVGAVIALVHDVLISVGALILAQYSFDLTTLAALLTVVGFSVHDTIIISDRIRETLRRNPKRDLESVMNQSINETLSRTLLTTGTALFVLIALYFLGGEGLEPFAFTLIVGFITGTYSTIYIAAPVVLLWANRSKLAG